MSSETYFLFHVVSAQQTLGRASRRLTVTNWCINTGDVSKQSESDSVSGGQSELFTEEMEKIIQDHEKAKDRPQRSALPMLTDQEWRGAILAAYNPSLLRTLKTRHLKEGRRNLKLPDPARRILLNWWTEHQGKPYPSVSNYFLLVPRCTFNVQAFSTLFELSSCSARVVPIWLQLSAYFLSSGSDYRIAIISSVMWPV